MEKEDQNIYLMKILLRGNALQISGRKEGKIALLTGEVK